MAPSIKPIILVIEHRTCQCGMEFLAPNPRALMRHELVNLHKASILLPTHVHSCLREIIHTYTTIEYCPACFKTINGEQFELFPKLELPRFTFLDGKLGVAEDKPKKVNEFGLGYF